MMHYMTNNQPSSEQDARVERSHEPARNSVTEIVSRTYIFPFSN